MSEVNRLPLGMAGGVDPDVVARAEAALKALSSQFARWLQDEIDKLEAARARVLQEGLPGGAGEVLYTRAHDLKGLGGTYEFPIVTRLAGSLCRLIDTAQARAAASVSLVDSHIEAIKLVVREGIRDDSHPMGAALAQDLEDRVAQARAAASQP